MSAFPKSGRSGGPKGMVAVGTQRTGAVFGHPIRFDLADFLLHKFAQALHRIYTDD